VIGRLKRVKKFYLRAVSNNPVFDQLDDVRRSILQLYDYDETGIDVRTDLGSRIVLGDELIDISHEGDTIDLLVKRFDVFALVGVVPAESVF